MKHPTEPPTLPLEMDRTVTEIVDRAVSQTFAILGVDVDNPESVENFREDLRFGRRLRRASGHGFLAIVAVIAAGIAAALWTGVVDLLK